MSYIFRQEDVFDFANVINAETKLKGNELFFKFCPYCHGGGHDKETFSVNLETGAYKCFRASCGKQGHFVELARDFNYELDFEDSKKKKYRKLPQRKPTPTLKAIEYMKSRNISPETTERYRLTTSKDDPNLLVFPFFDENYVLTTIKYRKTDFDKNKDKCKEWFVKDLKPILFGMAQCTDFERLIITEGQIDSLSVADCGYSNAVSVPNGANAFLWITLCWDWLIQFKEVIVFGDYENGKMTLIDEIQKRFPQKVKAVRYQDYLGEKDANAIYCKYGSQAIINCIENAEIQRLKNVKDLSEVETVDLNSLPKIKTNIKEIDRVIGGFCYGQVVLLSGKRGNGKSTFMSQLVCEALEQGESVFVYSGELADYHFKRWIDYQLAGKDNIECMTNEYNDSEYIIKDGVIERINAWYRGRAFIFDNNFLPEGDEFESLTETIENVIRQYGTKLICIDNLMTAMDAVVSNDNLYLAQSNFVGKLKKIAIRHNVVIILVAHPRKTDKEFTNDDVSGSSDITNKVDIVMSYQRDESGDTYNSKLTVTKNRLSGRLATGKNSIGLIYSEATKRIISQSSGIRKYGWEKEEPNYDDIEEIF